MSTAGELAGALATYPADAELVTGENGGGGGEVFVEDDGCLLQVWSGHEGDAPLTRDQSVAAHLRPPRPGPLASLFSRRQCSHDGQVT